MSPANGQLLHGTRAKTQTLEKDVSSLPRLEFMCLFSIAFFKTCFYIPSVWSSESAGSVMTKASFLMSAAGVSEIN